MITEIAQLDIKPGMESEFEEAMKKAVPIFERARGCHGLDLRRSIEKPNLYWLFVVWDTVDDHLVSIRGSRDFDAWRKLVGHCFAESPEVSHADQILSFS